MHKIKKYSIDEAIEYLSHIATAKKPLIVSVCGTANSGKTFFSIKAINKFYSQGQIAARTTKYDLLLDPNLRKADYFFYENTVTFGRPEAITIYNYTINQYAIRNFGKKVDVIAYIFNPSHILDENFLRESGLHIDLLIENSGSSIK